jgi:hypothetical protein
MTKLNWNRIILGGLAAGVVLVIMDMIAFGGVFNAQASAALAALGINFEDGGLSNLAAMIGFNLIVGLSAAWIYAHLRPRYEPGPRTAVIAGLAIWVAYYLAPGFSYLASNLFPASFVGLGVIVGLVESMIVAQIGAYLYRD